MCTARVVVAGVGLTILVGCIAVPIPLPEDTVLAGKPVTQDQLEFLAPAVTTREDVIEHLGNPNLIWEDQRVFAYDWDMRQGVVLWAVGAYYTGAAGIADIPKHYVFLIEFDDAWKVARATRRTRSMWVSYADFLREWNDGGRRADTYEAKALP